MTLYRDEDDNLESDDFIPRLATDEDLINRWKAAHSNKPMDVEGAKMIVLCASELGKRGYTTNEDETDWVME